MLPTISLSVLKEVDPVCLDFEDQWKAGRPPRIDEYLPRVSAESRPCLFRELLLLDAAYRRKRGEQPILADYLEQFREYSQIVEQVLSDTAARTAGATAGGHLPSVAQTPQVQGYVILELIARGGMGIVYRATDEKFGRSLALKVLLAEGAAQESVESRFLEEARINAQLQHPGVAPVHDLGRLDDGRPYFCMKLIEGETLAGLLMQRSSNQDDLFRFVNIFEQIAQTIAYAHQSGIIHRDLKPLNIMVGAFGEVQVMDWGLAKRLEHAATPLDSTRGSNDPSSAPAGQTGAGDLLGTPAYMAPEQARGEIETVDARCDVFGLGAILCEILTGRPPYDAASGRDAIDMAQRADLSDAVQRLQRCGCDPELSLLARQCLAKDPSQRPAEASEVAERISGYLTSVQQRAREAELKQTAAEARSHEERKRRRITVALAAAVTLLAAAAIWYFTYSRHRNRVAVVQIADGVEQASQKIQQLEELLSSSLVTNLVNDGGQQWKERLEAVAAELKRSEAFLAQAEAPTDLLNRKRNLDDQLKKHLAARELALELEQARTLGRLGGHTLPEETRFSNGPFVAPMRKTSEIGKRQAERDFERNFRTAGMSFHDDDYDKLVASVNASSIPRLLVAAIDHWAVLTDDAQLRDRLLRVNRRVDPHPLRERLRDPSNWASRERFKPLVIEAARAADHVPPPLLGVVLARLEILGGSDESIADLFRGRAIDDFWLLIVIGSIATDPAEQAGYFQAAIAVRKYSPLAHYNLGIAYWRQARVHTATPSGTPVSSDSTSKALRSAEMALRQATKLQESYVMAHHALGVLLLGIGNTQEAIKSLQHAIEMAEADELGAHTDQFYELGRAFEAAGDRQQALKSYQEALGRNDKNVAAINNIGTIFEQQGEAQAAIEQYRLAIAADPSFVGAYYNLGRMLGTQAAAAYENGQQEAALKGFAAAEVELRKALELDDQFAPTYTNLGIVVRFQDRLPEAIQLQRRSIELAPTFGLAHFNLALALSQIGDEQQARTHLREAFRVEPGTVEFYLANQIAGPLVLEEGKFQEALQEYQKVSELVPESGPERAMLQQHIEHCQEFIELDARLKRVLAGEEAVDTPWLDLAEFCQFIRRRFDLAANFYAEAFRRRPELAAQGDPSYRYDAACCAAIAGTTPQASSPTEKQQTAFRRQAYKWLRAELDAVVKASRQNNGSDGTSLQVLRIWLSDPQLSGIRQAEALQNLPAREARVWQKLWVEVQSLLPPAAETPVDN